MSRKIDDITIEDAKKLHKWFLNQNVDKLDEKTIKTNVRSWLRSNGYSLDEAFSLMTRERAGQPGRIF